MLQQARADRGDGARACGRVIVRRENIESNNAMRTTLQTGNLKLKDFDVSWLHSSTRIWSRAAAALESSKLSSHVESPTQEA
jgi:hypothetical protein